MKVAIVVDLIDELISTHSYHNRKYNFNPEESKKQINAVKKKLRKALRNP